VIVGNVSDPMEVARVFAISDIEGLVGMAEEERARGVRRCGSGGRSCGSPFECGFVRQVKALVALTVLRGR
jgi:hypothetical protein